MPQHRNTCLDDCKWKSCLMVKGFFSAKFLPGSCSNPWIYWMIMWSFQFAQNSIQAKHLDQRLGEVWLSTTLWTRKASERAGVLRRCAYQPSLDFWWKWTSERRGYIDLDLSIALRSLLSGSSFLVSRFFESCRRFSSPSSSDLISELMEEVLWPWRPPDRAAGWGGRVHLRLVVTPSQRYRSFLTAASPTQGPVGYISDSKLQLDLKWAFSLHHWNQMQNTWFSQYCFLSTTMQLCMSEKNKHFKDFHFRDSLSICLGKRKKKVLFGTVLFFVVYPEIMVLFG